MRKVMILGLVALTLVLALGACVAPATPATSAEPTAVEAASAPTATVEPTPTMETAGTADVTPTAELTATIEAAQTVTPTVGVTTTTATTTGEVPNAQTDPVAALLYAGSAQALQSGEFTYDMSMTMEPADDAAEKALGSAADMLKAFEMKVSGTGAMQAGDAQGQNNKMRMSLNLSAAGRASKVEVVVIGNTVWTRTGSGAWQRAQARPGQSQLPGGMDPNEMLSAFKDATDVQWVEDTTLNGEAVSHIRFTVDPSKFDMSSLTGNLGQNASREDVQKLLDNTTIAADVWLTKDNLELRQQQMHITMLVPAPEGVGNADTRIRMIMDATMQMQNINQPVTIEAPAQ